VKWRAFLVAAFGLAAALTACSLEPEWRAYCGHPGRCSHFDDGGTFYIAQGSSRRLTFTGQYLGDASTVQMEPAAGTASIVSSDDGHVLVDLSVEHAIQVGTQLTLVFQWDRPDADGIQIPPPVVVTPIWVGLDGTDGDGGYGTPDAPFATLRRAGQSSESGDTIHLGAGQFGSIYDRRITCDTPSGLKAGVSVEGESRDASVVFGSGDTGTCAFNLIGGNQTVSNLTITGFPEGIRVSNGGTRALISEVLVTGCDTGVMGQPASTFQLQDAGLTANGIGLLCDGCDVVVQEGTIAGSTGNGIHLTGLNGSLVLSGSSVQNNAAALTNPGDELTGAGVLIDGNTGTAVIGSSVSNNGRTGVTVAGDSNTVTFDGGNLQANLGQYALLVKDPNAGIYLRNTTMLNAVECIRVEGFSTFNGGTGDGAFGGNTLDCDPNTEIDDARPTVNSSRPLDFERTQIHGVTPPANTTVSATDATYGIKIQASGNKVVFH
jgi:parallel beta helix pectate lyase-like protein